MEEEIRLCRVCREERLIEDFQMGGKGARRPECRFCTNAARVRWAHSTPERNARALAMRREYTERRKQATGSHTETAWQAKVAAYGHRCAYCGARHKRLIKEHVVPVSAGGTNDLANLVPACQSCNARKLDRLDFPPPAPPGAFEA